MPSAPNPDLITAQDHVAPACPHFGSCGGCQLQNIAYTSQLALKSTRLSEILVATNLTLPKIQLHESPPYAYRNRIRLTLAEVDGQLRAGYLRNMLDEDETELNAAVTKTEFLPITQCPIAAPILWRTAEAFLTLINQDAAFWLRNPQLKLDQLELFTAADESKIQFTLYLRTQLKALPTKLTAAFTTLCETLRTQIPELTGAGISFLPPLSKDRSRRNELPRTGPAWGSAGLIYIVSENSYWVPRGAFFQANRFLLPELLALATSARTGELAFDLYAGVGLFSRALATHFTHVTAVEIAEPAAAALAATKLPNLHAVKATTLDFLRAAVIQRERPELIVLDPPRTGAGAEVCALFARIAAPTLIYVSCSPQALAADLITLAASGYTVSELHLLDLFPQTNHIETVAILTRL